MKIVKLNKKMIKLSGLYKIWAFENKVCINLKKKLAIKNLLFKILKSIIDFHI